MARAVGKAIVAAALLLAGCSKDDDPAPVPPAAGNARVLVVCEGSYGNGNGALSVLPAYSDSTGVENALAAANGKTALDVFQSLTRIGDQLFLCINNSDKILVVRRSDFKLEGSISVPKPRYILPVTATKAYVSSLFTNRITVINPQTLAVTGSVSLPGQNPEGMALLKNRIYVAPRDTARRFVYVLDPATDAIVDSLPAGRAPQEVLVDAAEKLWVLSGNDPQGITAAWTCVDPVTKGILRQFSFPAGLDVIYPSFNTTRDTLYWVQADYYNRTAGNGVFRMPVTATSLPAAAFVPAGGLQYFYGVGVDPRTGLVYIADPLGFTQRGTIHAYNAQGALVRSFKTGVGPAHFYFD